MTENDLIEIVAKVMAARTPSPVSWITPEEYVEQTWMQHAATARVIVALVRSNPPLDGGGAG